MKLVRIGSAAAAVAFSAAMLAGCSTASTSDGSSEGGGGGETGQMCPEGENSAFERPTDVKKTDEIVVAVEEIPNAYNNDTGQSNSFANSGVTTLVQPSAFLVDGDENVCMDGDLMESVEMTSEDPQVVEYKIKEEATWSDGQPVSCKDFYLDWLKSASASTAPGETGEAVPAFDPAGTSGYEQMQAPECTDGPDGKTIKTTYDTPYPDYKSLFAFLEPAHIVEEAAGGVDVTSFTKDDSSPELLAFAEQYRTLFEGYNLDAALSAGPYKIESASPEQVVLTANEDYWAGKAGPQKLVLKALFGAQTQIQALQNQEVQVIQPQPDGAAAQQLRGLEGVIFNAYAGLTYEHIDFNMDLPIFQGESGKALRKAVFQCVDRQEIVDKLVADVNPDTVPLGSFMFMPDEDGYEDLYADYKTKDIDAAKKTLEDAGWTMGADGVYELNGQKASFRLGHKIVDNRANISQLVAASCAEAGIQITDDVAENFNSERLPASDFDTALFAWVGNPFKTSSVANYTTDGGSNYNNYSSEKFDEAGEKALQELDPAKLDEYLKTMDEAMAEDLHSIPLYQFSDMVAQVDTLKPVLTYAGVSGGVLWNAYLWEME